MNRRNFFTALIACFAVPSVGYKVLKEIKPLGNRVYTAKGVIPFLKASNISYKEIETPYGDALFIEHPMFERVTSLPKKRHTTNKRSNNA